MEPAELQHTEGPDGGRCLYCDAPSWTAGDICQVTPQVLWSRIGAFTDRANALRTVQASADVSIVASAQAGAKAAELEEAALRCRRRHAVCAQPSPAMPTDPGNFRHRAHSPETSCVFCGLPGNLWGQERCPATAKDLQGLVAVQQGVTVAAWGTLEGSERALRQEADLLMLRRRLAAIETHERTQANG